MSCSGSCNCNCSCSCSCIYLSIHLSVCLSIYLLIYLSIYLSTYLPIYQSINLSIYQSINLSINQSIYLSVFLSFYLSIKLSFLSIYLSTCLSACLSVCLSTCKLENAAILQDFLSFWIWQRQKRSISARLPKCLNLTTSKTKQFCETSSFFEVENIKNEAILRDFFQTCKVENFSSRPSGASNHWKTQCFATFLPFRAPGSSSFWLFLFLLLFSSLLFSSLHFSSLLFSSLLWLFPSLLSSVHIVGSLTRKLPSIRPSIHRPCLWGLIICSHIHGFGLGKASLNLAERWDWRVNYDIVYDDIL